MRFPPSKVEDPEGRITRFVYNTDGSLFQKIQAPGYEFDTSGALVADASASGFITEYEYDAYGNNTKITDPIGNYQTTVFNATGIHPETRTDKKRESNPVHLL